MKLTIVNATGLGSPNPARMAAELLVFTKSTRLQMTPNLLQDIQQWDWTKLEGELKYMADTIPSSWEFVDYTFLIEGVTRAFTHQLVRSRHASFAQQTMRVLDVSEGSGWDYATGPSIKDDDDLGTAYEGMMGEIADTYKALVKGGAAIEDARGILPTNILTNIVMKINLRTFVEMVRKRSSPRVQGEYREVLDAMQWAVMEIHPWAALFLQRSPDQAARDLFEQIKLLRQEGNISPERAMRLSKLVDKVWQKDL